MKLEIINDNKIDLVFLISDSTPEFNLPNVKDDNVLLMKTKDGLKYLLLDDIKKLFLNNNENYKIYIFPQSPGETYFPVLFHDVLLTEVINKLENFINLNDLIDISYFIDNDLCYSLLYHEISRSFKNDINVLFEKIEQKIILNKNNFLNKTNRFLRLLDTSYIKKLDNPSFPSLNLDKNIDINNDFIESLPTSFNKIKISQDIDLSSFDEYENRLIKLQEKLKNIK